MSANQTHARRHVRAFGTGSRNAGMSKMVVAARSSVEHVCPVSVAIHETSACLDAGKELSAVVTAVRSLMDVAASLFVVHAPRQMSADYAVVVPIVSAAVKKSRRSVRGGLGKIGVIVVPSAVVEVGFRLARGGWLATDAAPRVTWITNHAKAHLVLCTVAGEIGLLFLIALLRATMAQKFQRSSAHVR